MLCLLVYYYDHVISVLMLVLVILLDSKLVDLLLHEENDYLSTFTEVSLLIRNEKNKPDLF